MLFDDDFESGLDGWTVPLGRGLGIDMTTPALTVPTAFDPDLAIRSDGRMLRWRPFAADHRGAVATGRVTELRGSRRVAYFHARVEAARTGDAELWLSTVDDLAIWVNGKFVGFAARQGYAWWEAIDHRPCPKTGSRRW